MRIAIAQINTTAGDIEGNLDRSLQAYRIALDSAADLIIYPELTITGYPPEDLLFRQDFLHAARDAVDTFAAQTTSCAAIIGAPEPSRFAKPYNAAFMCDKGTIQGAYRKAHLPNYGVFDEKRYFLPEPYGPGNTGAFAVAGKIIAISICEDAWVITSPLYVQARTADLLVNISASPYQAGRINDREELLSGIAEKTGTPLVYCNLVGGQDELVFDGGSLVFNGNGQVIFRAAQFFEEVPTIEIKPVGEGKVAKSVTGAAREHFESFGNPARTDLTAKLPPIEEVYEALVTGTSDYLTKTGYDHALLGLSGGIDSSLVAAIAVEALAPDAVLGVLMPSRYSSEGSLTDAQQLAEALEIETVTIPIEPTHAAMEDMLRHAFPTNWGEPGIAEENLQARARGNILMAISNKFGGMVLTTGNKSEMAIGYATLYGDMAGGFAVIKDVPKTLVYQLCEFVNERYGKEIIPKTVLTKPPSAELRFGQKDADSLPTYDILDPIIQAYVNDDLSTQDIISLGLTDPETVIDVCKMIDRNEYKRRQAPPGVRISPKAFGKDRRLPIANGWK